MPAPAPSVPTDAVAGTDAANATPADDSAQGESPPSEGEPEPAPAVDAPNADATSADADESAEDSPEQLPFLRGVDDREVVTMTTEQGPFTGLYREEKTGDPQGAVILVPDMNAHPDWHAVIGPLRRELPNHGWATLAIEMPRNAIQGDPGQLVFHSRNRIRAAVAQVRTEGYRHVAILGHGLGALLGADYAGGSEATGVGGLVAVSMGEYPGLGEELEPGRLLARVKVPVFDIYAEKDIGGVLLSGDKRRSAGLNGALAISAEGMRRRKSEDSGFDDEARFAARPYRQWSVTGADHSFRGFEERLAKRIRGWLKRHVEERDGPMIPPEFFVAPATEAAAADAEEPGTETVPLDAVPAEAEDAASDEGGTASGDAQTANAVPPDAPGGQPEADVAEETVR